MTELPALFEKVRKELKKRINTKDAASHFDCATALAALDEIEKSKECWLWSRAISSTGYAVARLGKKPTGKTPMRHVHKWLWEQINGVVPGGRQLDHLCRVRHCVNPWHLELVDNRTNVLRGIGPTAINARKTKCPVGHPLSGKNLYVHNGKRSCRKCSVWRTKVWREAIRKACRGEK